MSTIHTPSAHVLVKPSILPLLRDNVAINGLSADCAGYSRALVIIYSGATDITDGISLEDSADDSTFAAVASSTQTFSATDDNKIKLIDVDLTKRARYLRVIAAAADGVAGTTISACICLFNGRTKSPSQDNTVVSV